MKSINFPSFFCSFDKNKFLNKFHNNRYVPINFKEFEFYIHDFDYITYLTKVFFLNAFGKRKYSSVKISTNKNINNNFIDIEIFKLLSKKLNLNLSFKILIAIILAGYWI